MGPVWGWVGVRAPGQRCAGRRLSRQHNRPQNHCQIRFTPLPKSDF